MIQVSVITPTFSAAFGLQTLPRIGERIFLKNMEGK